MVKLHFQQCFFLLFFLLKHFYTNPNYSHLSFNKLLINIYIFFLFSIFLISLLSNSHLSFFFIIFIISLISFSIQAGFGPHLKNRIEAVHCFKWRHQSKQAICFEQQNWPNFCREYQSLLIWKHLGHDTRKNEYFLFIAFLRYLRKHQNICGIFAGQKRRHFGRPKTQR